MKIEGCLVEKPFYDYFSNRYPERVTYFSDNFNENNYGFGFQKNEEGEKLLNEFNEFLNKTDIDSIYYKWTHTRTKELHVDTSLNSSSDKIINVAINMDFIPLGFYHLDATKGYKLESIYLFAKEYNYQINFTRLDSDSQRMTNLTEGIANITGGHFTITEERKKSIHFSEPILESNNVFVIRTDSKKEFLTNIVIDENYEEKPNNNVDIEVKFSNITKTSSCVFPRQYNDTIIVNCTISNVTENNPYFEGFEYGDSKDKILFTYYTFNATTLFNANKLLSNYTIITESNKNNIICPSETDEEEGNITNYNTKMKSEKTLSTGAIVGILVPTIVVLVGVTAFVLGMGMSSAPVASIAQTETSIQNLKNI